MLSAQLNNNKKKSLRSMTDCPSEKLLIEQISNLKRFKPNGHLVKRPNVRVNDTRSKMFQSERDSNQTDIW
jgi:hypothetical protein